MFKPRKFIISMAVAASLLTGAFAQELIKGNWDPFNRDQLNNLIKKHGKANPNYNPDDRAYAVFDWDNSSVFLDIQEAILIYQLENLQYKMPPETMDIVMRMKVPADNFVADHNNKAGQPVNIDLVTQDVVAAYTWIYNNFDQMKGDKPLSEIQKTDQYKEFITKVRYLYGAIGDSFDVAISYPWVTYHFTGMNEKDVRTLTAETVEWQIKQPIEKVTWTSPAIESKAGQVSTSWNNGYRLVPEMQDLYAKLREAGIDPLVCSASFIDVIKEISSNPKFGYNNPDTSVIAMELERDANGVILPEFRKGYDQTQGPGKTKAINRFFLPKYNGKGPILVVTDSEGDQNMVQDYKDTEIGIIINRLRSPKTDIGKFSAEAVKTYKDPKAKYLLQGRNENTGIFIPSQKMIKLGQTEEQLLRQ